ncbi:hypothetical protein KCP74_14155 [Salmonella enterica subsp. enterica]|nr:hypothetical protein KCP74_14155 [Salmonella enterica subsp. enterica]
MPILRRLLQLSAFALPVMRWYQVRRGWMPTMLLMTSCRRSTAVQCQPTPRCDASPGFMWSPVPALLLRRCCG